MDKSNGLVLKMEKKQFAEFIANLLGKQQTISNSMRGAFEITIKDLINIFHLVDQRINQQNEANLIQFRTKIIYNDESSILLGSLTELETFNEIRKVIPMSVHLEFDYLIKFQDKQTPERQEIEISFIAADPAFGRFQLLYDTPLKVMALGGFINFRIKHTARTWGADIESLLSNQLSNIFKVENKLKHFIRLHSSKISLSIQLIFLLSIFISIYYTTKNFAMVTTNSLAKELSKTLPNQFDLINHKITTIGVFLSSGIWAQYYFYVLIFVIIGIILAVILGAWIDSSIDTVEPSFIILTKESEKHKLKIEKKLNRKWIYFVISIMVSVATSLIANILFKKLFC